MAFRTLKPRFLEKVWGSHHLSPWFEDSPLKIGEVWLEGPQGEPLPLLIKFLFTTAPLSVQVHPNDEYAWTHHQSKGKTEMWHILRADPGARIALGLKAAITAEQLRLDSESGAIEQKLNMIEVHSGDTYFVPAGTIHAIGSGIALCEIQQQSDVTYRLYDYGRPRPLQLDQAVAVSGLMAYKPPAPASAGALAECDYFRTERMELEEGMLVQPESNRPFWLICIEGEAAGQAWQVDAGAEPERLPAGVFIKTFVP